MNRMIESVLIALSTAAVFAGCADDPDAANAAATSDDITTAGGAPAVTSAAWAQILAAPTTPGLAAAYALASNNAAALVASRPAFLHASSNDAFVQGRMESSGGHFYVPYERTYAGLPVVGGDFVMVIDGAGQLAYHSDALEHPIDLPSITPTLSQAAAETIATQRLRSVTNVEGTQLVVNALGPTARLAWESTVDGFGAKGISRLTVDVDAITGAVLREQEHVMYGTGTSAWNGPNPVTLQTTQSGSAFSMRDPTITNLSCQDAANNTTFSGTDDLWGNGNATSRETGCVDALFAAQTEARMLNQWLGRNGMDGVGGAWPIRVGLAQVNAFYDGTQVQVGHNNANQWIGSIDVIAHEMGHGIDDHTGMVISDSCTQEFIADAFGASTEWFANEPAPFDIPDFTVGEQVNLVGSGPIRIMYNPSLLGDPNCYSSSLCTNEVHTVAGPGNHWFYLLAEGTNPTNGQPTSPTCNGSTVVGLGVQNAIKILYTAMLMKTTGVSYLKYRTWTLQAAKILFPSSCTEFNTVKAAWDAVSVPAQAGDPTCGCSAPDFSLSASPSSRSVVQGASTTYTVTETPSCGFTGSVTLAASGLPTGATAAFSPNPTTGTSTLTVTTATTTPTGSFTITITGTSGTLSHTTTVTLVVTVGGCSGGTNLLLNPGFESGTSPWTATAGVINTGLPPPPFPHSGIGLAWLDGYGTTHTDSLFQQVTIPSTSTCAQLCYWLSITTAETTTTTQFDKLSVQLRSSADTVLTTLGTFSNLSAGAFSTYKQVCLNVGSFAGQTVRPYFLGTEDSTLQTSFFIDDISLSVTVPPNDFSITLTPPSQTVTKITSATYTINTAVTMGVSQGIALSVSDLPDGVTGSFSPTNVTAGGSSTLTLTADADATPVATPVTMEFTVTATGASATHTVNASVTVANPPHWSGSASPNLSTVDNGVACTPPLTVTTTGGDSSLAKLDISGSHTNRPSLRGTLEHNGVTKDAFLVGEDPTGFPPGGGTFALTNHPVAGLSGDASGTWTLCIIDTDAFGDVGMLNTWSVHD